MCEYALRLIQPGLNHVSHRLTVTEAGNHQNTTLEDLKGLFPTTDPCTDRCSFPAIWSSPLTCRWSNETNSKTSTEAQMLSLADLTHQWLATFLDRDGQGRIATNELLEERTNLRRRIELLQPTSEMSSIEAEAMYESCRWATLILLSVEKLHIPIRVAPEYVADEPRLISRLRKTDLSSLWGCRKGLLFWIVAVCHFSSAGKCLPLLCTTLFAQFSQELAMSDACLEIAIKPLRRLKQFEILCCCPEI